MLDVLKVLRGGRARSFLYPGLPTAMTHERHRYIFSAEARPVLRGTASYRMHASPLSVGSRQLFFKENTPPPPRESDEKCYDNSRR